MLKIGTFFETFLEKNSIFTDKNVLMSSYFPEEVLFREEQIQEAANILAPALRLEKPSNLFIYGKTGSGKTLSIKYVLRSLADVAQKKNISLKSIYVNCKLKKVADTEYRLIAQLITLFGQEVPATGLPTD